MPKDARFYRHLAERCREHLADSKTQVAKDQLELWLTEFEAQADEAEQGELAEIRARC
jgi:hypothetical protein